MQTRPPSRVSAPTPLPTLPPRTQAVCDTRAGAELLRQLLAVLQEFLFRLGYLAPGVVQQPKLGCEYVPDVALAFVKLMRATRRARRLASICSDIPAKRESEKDGGVPARNGS